MNKLEEIIKKESGAKPWVLRSKDGSKVLGRFTTEDEAKKREAQIIAAMAAKESDVGLAIVGERAWVTEGGRLTFSDLNEYYALPRMDDDELKKIRNEFITSRMKKQKAHSDMADDKKFASPEGQQLLADIEYYSGVIRQVEWELASRFAKLD